MSLYYYTAVWDTEDHECAIVSHIELDMPFIEDVTSFATMEHIKEAIFIAEIDEAVAHCVSANDMHGFTLHAIFPGHLQSYA